VISEKDILAASSSAAPANVAGNRPRYHAFQEWRPSGPDDGWLHPRSRLIAKISDTLDPSFHSAFEVARWVTASRPNPPYKNECLIESDLE
jgi:hypothetical protein